MRRARDAIYKSVHSGTTTTGRVSVCASEMVCGMYLRPPIRACVAARFGVVGMYSSVGGSVRCGLVEPVSKCSSRRRRREHFFASRLNIIRPRRAAFARLRWQHGVLLWRRVISPHCFSYAIDLCAFMFARWHGARTPTLRRKEPVTRGCIAKAAHSSGRDCPCRRRCDRRPCIWL